MPDWVKAKIYTKYEYLNYICVYKRIHVWNIVDSIYICTPDEDEDRIHCLHCIYTM
jgi:hypothetical protein